MKADIAIITTRQDEFDAVSERLDEYTPEPFNGPSGRTYARFLVPARESKLAIALTRSYEQGPDAAQQISADALRDLDPQLLLVVGIAGGFPHNEFTLGDVILSSRIHNFNVNAISQSTIDFDAKGTIHPFVGNLTGTLSIYRRYLVGWNERESIGLARPIVDLPWAQSHLYGDDQWRAKVLKSLETHFGSAASASRLPLYKDGSIASSGSLMKNTTIPMKWLENVRSLLAVEMESAGAFQASQQMHQQYPVMAIRGISDIIGLERDERWTAYACQTAGAFTCAFIKAGIIKPRASSTPTARPRAVNPPLPTSTWQENQKSSEEPLDVFISYATEDEKLKKELENHLVMLKREGIIRPWHSQQIDPGDEWASEISDLIDRSQIILLLISPNFLRSDHLYENEMMRAMQRHDSKQARVIPIMIRSADIENTPFHKLMMLPRNQQPVDTARNHDEVWVEIAREIRRLCESLRNGQHY